MRTFLPQATQTFPWCFNDPYGQIGLKALDSPKGATIAFVPGRTIDPGLVKMSARAITRIGAPFVPYEQLDNLIEAANARLATLRANTGDVLMTSFKGVRTDGRYRRRLDFQTARAILNDAWGSFS